MQKPTLPAGVSVLSISSQLPCALCSTWCEEDQAVLFETFLLAGIASFSLEQKLAFKNMSQIDRVGSKGLT